MDSSDSIIIVAVESQPAPAAKLAEAIMRTQRGFTQRLYRFTPNHGRPIHVSKPNPEQQKQVRKALKKIRRDAARADMPAPASKLWTPE